MQQGLIHQSGNQRFQKKKNSSIKNKKQKAEKKSIRKENGDAIVGDQEKKSAKRTK